MISKSEANKLESARVHRTLKYAKQQRPQHLRRDVHIENQILTIYTVEKFLTSLGKIIAFIGEEKGLMKYIVC